MKKLILRVAMSNDGFIADKKGNVTWMHPFKMDMSCLSDFIDSIDTIIMGFNSYTKIIEMSPDWPWPNRLTYVYGKGNDKDNIKFVQTEPAKLLKQIREKSDSKKNIWMFGGASIIESFLKVDLIDEFIISKNNNFDLKEGIALWKSINPMKNLKLTLEKPDGDFTQYRYAKK